MLYTVYSEMQCSNVEVEILPLQLNGVTKGRGHMQAAANLEAALSPYKHVIFFCFEIGKLISKFSFIEINFFKKFLENN